MAHQRPSPPAITNGFDGPRRDGDALLKGEYLGDGRNRPTDPTKQLRAVGHWTNGQDQLTTEPLRGGME